MTTLDSPSPPHRPIQDGGPVISDTRGHEYGSSTTGPPLGTSTSAPPTAYIHSPTAPVATITSTNTPTPSSASTSTSIHLHLEPDTHPHQLQHPRHWHRRIRRPRDFSCYFGLYSTPTSTRTTSNPTRNTQTTLTNNHGHALLDLDPTTYDPLCEYACSHGSRTNVGYSTSPRPGRVCVRGNSLRRRPRQENRGFRLRG